MTARILAAAARFRELCDRDLNVGERVYLPLGPFAIFYAQDTRALSAAARNAPTRRVIAGNTAASISA